MKTDFTIVYEPSDDGGYTAFIPEVPGAISEGETQDEAREMVLEALHELVASRRETALSATGPKALIEHFAPSFSLSNPVVARRRSPEISAEWCCVSRPYALGWPPKHRFQD